MGAIFYLLLVVYILACVIMVVAILIHEPKSGGLATALGGSGAESAFGASIGRKINRFTAGAVAVFLVFSIALGIMWRMADEVPPAGPPPGTQAPAGGNQKEEKAGAGDKDGGAGEKSPAPEGTPGAQDGAAEPGSSEPAPGR